MEAKAVVAPHDVLQELVVSTVVRRVDDALVLPAAPGMSPCRGKADTESVGELAELRTPLRHQLDYFAEVRATPGLYLDLGCDQLADEVLVERRSSRSSLELLEAVRQLERVGIEDCELFLHGNREVVSILECLTRGANLLLGTESLLVTHVTRVNEAMRVNRCRSARAGVRRCSSSSNARRRRAGPLRRAPLARWV